MADFDVQQVVEAAARAMFKRTTGGDWNQLLDSVKETWRFEATAALAVIVPAVTEQVRALHESHHWCISDEGTPDMFSPDKSLGFPWPCRERPLLDELDAAAKGEQP